ncbi:hypothetical protein AB0I52_08215 [Streptomyces sp. NPDC050423]|uniref:hypothetical protein n=1 Tax=Streptomyces sp. NPDC050423 TaxID=3155402 RepID=UPI00342CD72F
MADEQYEWLDKEAAERLLRREPVDPADGQPEQEAERLAAALDAAARSARPATGELPGEAAALAAFRAVPRAAAGTRSASARAGRGTAAGLDGTGETGMLAPVHIGRAASGSGSGSAGFRGARPSHWSRPIRFGLVASLACCAIGGVAVAAGTGVLPGPFGRHAPSPATSVSAAASPEELGSGLTTDDGTPEPPSGSASTESVPPKTPESARPGGKSTAGPGSSGPTAPATDGATGTGPHDGTANGSSDSAGGTDGDGDGAGKPDTSQDGTSGAWYAKTLKACRDYRDGKLDDDRRSRLEALAKGARNLDRFCDRMLDEAGDNQGNGQGNGQNGDGGDSDGDGDSPPGGSGSLPSIGFTPVSPQPSTAFAGTDPATGPVSDPGSGPEHEPAADATASQPAAPGIPVAAR